MPHCALTSCYQHVLLEMQPHLSPFVIQVVFCIKFVYMWLYSCISTLSFHVFLFFCTWEGDHTIRTTCSWHTYTSSVLQCPTRTCWSYLGMCYCNDVGLRANMLFSSTCLTVPKIPSRNLSDGHHKCAMWCIHGWMVFARTMMVEELHSTLAFVFVFVFTCQKATYCSFLVFPSWFFKFHKTYAIQDQHCLF